MIIYSANGGGHKIAQQQQQHKLGVMLTPPDYTIREAHKDMNIAIDNGAFANWQKGYGFNEYAFLKLLDKIISRKQPYQFVVCPDIVAGGLASRDFSMMWKNRLVNWKLYFVTQDGMRTQDVNLDGFEGLFVGGTKEWKWKTAHKWVDFAHEKNKKCHIGQCGTLKRLLYAESIGADSVDSTNFIRNYSYHTIEQYYKQKGLALF